MESVECFDFLKDATSQIVDNGGKNIGEKRASKADQELLVVKKSKTESTNKNLKVESHHSPPLKSVISIDNLLANNNEIKKDIKREENE